MLDAARSSGRCARNRRKAIVRHAEVLRDGSGQVIHSIIVLLFLPAMLTVDTLLAGGCVDFLLSQSPDLATWGNPTLLKIVTLGMILVIEIEIALSMSRARDRNRRAVIPLAAAGLAIASLMAYMSFVLMAAHAANEGLEGSSEWLPWAVAGFTFVLHSLAIFSGDRVRIALGWLAFGVEYGAITVLRANYNLRAQDGRRAVGRICRRYARQIARHNTDYPSSRVEFGPIEADLESVLETLFSPAELRHMRGAPDEDPTPPEPAHPSSPEQASEATRSDDATDDVAEDYSAIAAEVEAQHAEEEVTA